THGTGCTLSAAIAAGLAKGLSLQDAVGQAHRYLQRAILAADGLGVGHGHGPVHHFHAMWS
ncbi:MAG: bifunctional hydroxymethylpyrimidine kinase/phosphomethylpyrimidine kinase, partial [Pseudomonadota bacterium]